MSGWAGAVWHAWAALLRRPAFVALAVATLATGLAAFTAALALAHALLWQRPPFAGIDRVMIYGGSYESDQGRSASPRFIEATADLPGVASRGVTRLPRAVNVVMGERRWLLHGQHVSPGFLDTLGVAPFAGSNLRRSAGAMISYDFWRRQLRARENVIGQEVSIDGHRMPIVGVLPPGYRFFSDVDVIVPLGSMRPADQTADNLVALARLQPGVDIDTFSHAVASRAHDPHFGATPLFDVLTWPARRATLALLACAGGVLAVAGINLSNLMLGRGMARSRDTAIRMALGAHAATPWVLALAEAIVIGVLAAGLGVWLGSLLVTTFGDAVPENWRTTSLPLAVAPSVCLMAVAADAVLVLLAAASASIHDRMQDLLRERVVVDGRGGRGSMARRARACMVWLQALLATALLVFGSAAVADLWRMEKIDPGFDATHTRFAPLHPDASIYPARDDVLALLDTLRADTYASPGDPPLAFTNQLPLGDGLVMPFLDGSGRRRFVRYVVTTPGAAESMGMTLLSGRWLGAADRDGEPAAALVNRAYLETMGGGLGGLALPDSRVAHMEPLRIVGVVADTRVAEPSERSTATVFVSLAQVNPTVFAFIRHLMPMYAVWRSADNAPPPAAEVLASRLRKVAPDLADGTPLPLGQLMRDVRARERHGAMLLSVLSLSALFLAVISLSSSQSVDVAAHRRSLALLAAFGAPRRHLMHGVVTTYLVAALSGAVMGASAALLAHTHLPVDGVGARAVFTAILIFVVAMLAAAAVPGWRAATIEPLAVLRGG